MEHSDILFARYKEVVKPEWIDVNGHMNVAYYVLAFDLATDAFLNSIGGGESYVHDQGGSFFIVEMNVSYKQELRLNNPLCFTTQVVDINPKKIHLYHRMYHQEEGYLAATNEILLLHIDMETRRSAPMNVDMLQQLERVKKAHECLPEPDNLSRRFGV